MFDHRFERSRHARRPGHEMEMARKTAERRKTNRQTEPHHGSRTGMLGKVRPLLRCGTARDTDGTRPPAHDPGRGDKAYRRKYHRCRADFRRDLHPTVRAGQGDKRRAGRLPEADGARYPHPCGRCQRRFHRPLHPAGYRMGFPPAARKIHQRFGPQVRSLAAGCGLGGMARRKATYRKT